MTSASARLRALSLLRRRWATAVIGAATMTAVAVPALANSPAGATPISWSLIKTPNVLVANGSLYSVSCSSATFCEAVGGYTDLEGASRPFAENFNGSTWSLQTIALPPQTKAQHLGSVSCSSRTFCVAGGYFQPADASWRGTRPYIEMWNGKTWAPATAVVSAGDDWGFLLGAKCLSASWCMVVGAQSATASGYVSTLSDVWNGVTWSAQTTTNGSFRNSELNSVSCSRTNYCMAVGDSGPYLRGANLAELWNGSVWATTPTPNPSGSNQGLTSVSCSAVAAWYPTNCVATAVYSRRGAQPPETEYWNGTAWKLYKAPNANGTQLHDVSCSWQTTCTAVGDVSGVSVAGAVFNGKYWKLAQPAQPSASSGLSLPSVSCPTTSECVAVGSLEATSGGTPTTLAEVDTNGTWAVSASPTPVGSLQSALTGISCPTASACVAAGYSSAGTLIEDWNGTHWSIHPSADPGNGATGIQVTGVSCASASRCAVVGSYFDVNFRELAFAEVWNGAAWTMTSVPAPTSGAAFNLTGVSCTGTSVCEAVGSMNNATGNVVAVGEIWNGSKWTAHVVAAPKGGSEAALSSVSCPSADDCVAAGTYIPSALGNPVPFADTWNGKAFVPETMPYTTGSGDNAWSPMSISCPAVNACTAAGQYFSGTASGFGGIVPMAWRLDGSKWAIESTPFVSGSLATIFSSVSCASATSCHAVGQYANSHNLASTFAATWNGSAWTRDTTPNPNGNNNLTGIACTSATRCLSIGYSAVPNWITLGMQVG